MPGPWFPSFLTVLSHVHRLNPSPSPVPGKLDIYYLGVAGPPAKFVLVDTKSGKEHVIPIEAGTHITYDNAVYEHRVDAHPDSKRTMLGPVSRLEPRRKLPTWITECTPCCTEGEENCEVAGCMPLLDGGVHRLTDRRLQGGS